MANGTTRWSVLTVDPRETHKLDEICTIILCNNVLNNVIVQIQFIFNSLNILTNNFLLQYFIAIIIFSTLADFKEQLKNLNILDNYLEYVYKKMSNINDCVNDIIKCS